MREFIGCGIACLALIYILQLTSGTFRMARKAGYTWEFWYLLVTEIMLAGVVVLFVLDLMGL